MARKSATVKKHNQLHDTEDGQPQSDEATGKTPRSDSERIAVLERNFRVLVKKLRTHGIHLTSDAPAAPAEE